MIIINFIIDYLIMVLLPVNSFFIVNEIDKNNIFNVVIVGILVDIMYHKILAFLLILIILFIVVKKLNIRSKYYYIKNIILYILFFIIVGEYKLVDFFISLFIQVIYMFCYKKLLK